MTNRILKYKGYLGSCEVDFDSNCLRGKILHISGLVTYIATDPKSLQEEFELAVEDYLEFCNEEGVQPEKPFSGSFNIRTSSELHRKLAYAATESNMKLNEFINKLFIDHFSMHKLQSELKDKIAKHIATKTSMEKPSFSGRFSNVVPFTDRNDNKEARNG